MKIKPIWIVVVGIVAVVMFPTYVLTGGANVEDGETNFLVVGYIIVIVVGIFGLLELNHRRS